jgi:beta-lactamase regulating signal transducer with metallopeptidase domain
VPDEWNQWPDETRRIVLDHELAHHRRRDPLWRWIAGVACVVNGGNPLVIWMVRRLTIQCEFACDAMVLKQGVAVRAYANLLCDFAEARPPSGPMLAMATSSTLESRVRRLLNPRPPKGTAGLVALAVLTLTIAASLSMIGAGRIIPAPVSRDEVRTRWAADPFPGETLAAEATGR